MIFERLTLRNFGPYRGTHTIELTPSEPARPIILVGALNGAGKTTLLDALRLVLYGRFAECSNRGSLAYDEFLRRSIHRMADPAEGAALELDFNFAAEGGEQRYRLRRAWISTRSGIRETTEVWLDGEADRVLAEGWDERVETFLPRRIAPLFLFDGEKIEELADPQRSGEFLSAAVHSLLGIDLVGQLETDLLVLERRTRRSKVRSDAQERLLRAEAELRSADDVHRARVQDRAAAQTEYDRRAKAHREADERFRREGGVAFERRGELEAIRVSAEAHRKALRLEILTTTAGATPLLLVADLLEAVWRRAREEEAGERDHAVLAVLDGRDREVLRLLEEAGVPAAAAAQVHAFFDGDRRRRSSHAAGERYLKLDSEVSAEVARLRDPEAVTAARQRVRDLLAGLRDSQGQLDEVERTLASLPNEEAILPLIAAREEAAAVLSAASARLAAADQALHDAAQAKEARVAALTSLRVQEAEEELELEAERRVVAYSQRARGTLARFRESVVARQVTRIETLILDSYQALLRKSSLVTGLTVDPVDFGVRLRGPDGNELRPDRLSAGERQLLAVAVLWGLARASGRTLPVVIDTPLGRLDATHRAHLVERYFPHAGPQVVLLSTDQEIDASFRDQLRTHIGAEYQLVFDDARDSTAIVEGYFAGVVAHGH